MSTSNTEPRRFWRAGSTRSREKAACASCGARASIYSSALPCCEACMEWSRQGSLAEWDDLGGGD